MILIIYGASNTKSSSKTQPLHAVSIVRMLVSLDQFQDFYNTGKTNCIICIEAEHIAYNFKPNE